MERFCDDAHHDHAGRVHREGEDDEHHAEMGPEHHDSVVNHLDVIGESKFLQLEPFRVRLLPSFRAHLSPSASLPRFSFHHSLSNRSHRLGRLSLSEHLVWNPLTWLAHA